MNSEQAEDLTLLTAEQKKAFDSLRRAYKRCLKSGIYFHQVLESLQAYNGNNVKNVDDIPEDGWITQSMSPPTLYMVSGWADDDHYVHFRNGVDKKIE